MTQKMSKLCFWTIFTLCLVGIVVGHNSRYHQKNYRHRRLNSLSWKSHNHTDVESILKSNQTEIILKVSSSTLPPTNESYPDHIALSLSMGQTTFQLTLDRKDKNSILANDARLWTSSPNDSSNDPNPLVDGIYLNPQSLDASTDSLSCLYHGSVKINRNNGSARIHNNHRYGGRGDTGTLVGDLCTGNGRLRALINLYDEYWTLEANPGDNHTDEYILKRALSQLSELAIGSADDLKSKVVPIQLTSDDQRYKNIENFIEYQNPEIFRPTNTSTAGPTTGPEKNDSSSQFLADTIVASAVAYHIGNDQLNPINYPVYTKYLDGKHKTDLFTNNYAADKPGEGGINETVAAIPYEDLRFGKANVYCGDNKYHNNKLGNVSHSCSSLIEPSGDGVGKALEISLSVFADDKMVEFIESELRRLNRPIDNEEIVKYLTHIFNQVEFLFQEKAMKSILKISILIKNIFLMRSLPDPAIDIHDALLLTERLNVFTKKIEGTHPTNTFVWLSGVDFFTRFYFIQDFQTQGYAYYGDVLCKSKLNGLSVEGNRGFSTIRTIVHEIGHNLNLDHDDSGGCGSGIMSPYINQKSLMWSDCSLDAMKKFVDSA